MEDKELKEILEQYKVDDMGNYDFTSIEDMELLMKLIELSKKEDDDTRLSVVWEDKE